MNRDIEKLIPTLRSLDIPLLCYNPLAGGLLSGKYSFDQTVSAGRFWENPAYQGRYWKKDTFQALEMIDKSCKEHGITVLNAAFSWLIHHSMLDAEKGDGIVLGCSSIQQLEQNLAGTLKSTELPPELVETIERAWPLCLATAFEYFRGYSKQEE